MEQMQPQNQGTMLGMSKYLILEKFLLCET